MRTSLLLTLMLSACATQDADQATDTADTGTVTVPSTAPWTTDRRFPTPCSVWAIGVEDRERYLSSSEPHLLMQADIDDNGYPSRWFQPIDSNPYLDLPEDNESFFEVDAQGRLLSVTYTKRTWGSDGTPLPLETTTEHTYEGEGLLPVRIVSDSSVSGEDILHEDHRFTWNGEDLVEHAYEFTYQMPGDPDGPTTQIATETWHRDDQGRMIQQILDTEAGQRLYDLTWDASGQLVAILEQVGPSGEETSTFDEVFRVELQHEGLDIQEYEAHSGDDIPDQPGRIWHTNDEGRLVGYTVDGFEGPVRADLEPVPDLDGAPGYIMPFGPAQGVPEGFATRYWYQGALPEPPAPGHARFPTAWSLAATPYGREHLNLQPRATFDAGVPFLQMTNERPGLKRIQYWSSRSEAHEDVRRFRHDEAGNLTQVWDYEEGNLIRVTHFDYACYDGMLAEMPARLQDMPFELP